MGMFNEPYVQVRSAVGFANVRACMRLSLSVCVCVCVCDTCVIRV